MVGASSCSSFAAGTASTDRIIFTWEFHLVTFADCSLTCPSILSVAIVDLCTWLTILETLLRTRFSWPAYLNPSLTTSWMVWQKHGLWFAGSCSYSSCGIIILESISSSSSESSAVVSNSGNDNAFTMFDALSVRILDTFDAMLYAWRVILLHYVVSSVSTPESFVCEHDRFHGPVDNEMTSHSQIWAHLSTRPNVQCDVHALCTVQLLDDLRVHIGSLLLEESVNKMFAT